MAPFNKNSVLEYKKCCYLSMAVKKAIIRFKITHQNIKYKSKGVKGRAKEFQAQLFDYLGPTFDVTEQDVRRWYETHDWIRESDEKCPKGESGKLLLREVEAEIKLGAQQERHDTDRDEGEEDWEEMERPICNTSQNEVRSYPPANNQSTTDRDELLQRPISSQRDDEPLQVVPEVSLVSSNEANLPDLRIIDLSLISNSQNDQIEDSTTPSPPPVPRSPSAFEPVQPVGNGFPQNMETYGQYKGDHLPLRRSRTTTHRRALRLIPNISQSLPTVITLSSDPPEGNDQMPPNQLPGHAQMPSNQQQGHVQMPPNQQQGHAQMPPNQQEGHFQLPANQSPSHAQIPPNQQQCHAQMPPNQQQGHFQIPPNQQPGQFQIPPNQQQGHFQIPPNQQPGHFQIPHNQQPGQFQMPPNQQPGQFQIPPNQQPGHFQMPPNQQQGHFQMPPNQQQGHFQMPPPSPEQFDPVPEQLQNTVNTLQSMHNFWKLFSSLGTLEEKMYLYRNLTKNYEHVQRAMRDLILPSVYGNGNGWNAFY